MLSALPPTTTTVMPGWDNLGLRNLKPQAGTWNTKTEKDGSITLKITNLYAGSGPANFSTQMEYRVLADGTVSVSSKIVPWRNGVAVPKIGYRFYMPEGYENFDWYGRGPWDNYRDRKESCFRDSITAPSASNGRDLQSRRKQATRKMCAT